jgi:hypothetical protein
VNGGVVHGIRAAVAASAALWMAGSGAVLAHHSFAAQFDAENPVSVTGKIIELRWSNPHAHLYLEVADSAGAPAAWDFELGSPNALVRRGWSRTALKPGDVVTVIGYPAKTVAHLANARSIVLPDGRTVFAESPYENGLEK